MMEQTIAIAGVQIHTLFIRHEAAPADTALVLLHDSLGCVRLWRDLPQRLSEACSCNVLVYDRRGYGASAPFAPGPRPKNYMELEADALTDVLDHFGTVRALLFGHSDGGTIALLAAAKHPARIAGLVTEGAHVFVEDITLQGIRRAVNAYESTDLKQRLERYQGSNTQAVFEAWTQTWLSPAFRDWNIESFLPAVQCPALIIQGMEDEYGTEAQVDAIVEAVSGPATKWMIPGVGHTPHKEAREAVVERVAEWMLEC